MLSIFETERFETERFDLNKFTVCCACKNITTDINNKKNNLVFILW